MCTAELYFHFSCIRENNFGNLSCKYIFILVHIFDTIEFRQLEIKNEPMCEAHIMNKGNVSHFRTIRSSAIKSHTSLQS